MRKLLGGLAVFTAPVAAMAMLTSSQHVNESARGATAKGLMAAGEKAQLDDLAELCGIECGDFAKGEASVTGVGSIDAFFGAVLTVESKTLAVEGELKATLGQMAAIVGVEVAANASLEATADAVVTGFAEFKGQIDGDLTFAYQPPKCSVSIDATLDAQAKCEAKATPPKVDVECKGECVAEANVEPPACEGEVKCTGTAPSFACEGTCEGSCELEAGAKCEGTCKGSCELDGSAACDGECQGDTDEGGNCTGECKLNAGAKCEGECKGSCELSAGATCTGQCKGECTYDPGEAKCNGRVSCTPPSANASVKCNGECKGEVQPPEVSAECEASVKAEAEMSAECTPPSVKLDYDLKADFSFEGGADASAKAVFAAKLEAFGKAYGKLLAQGQKIEGILRASGNLGDAAGDAIVDAGEKASGDFAVTFKLGLCLPDAITAATGKLSASAGKLEASASAVAKITGAISG
jgi:hypothetical protein